MTELNFKGKEFVWNHHLTVPFRPLEPHPEKGIGEPALDGRQGPEVTLARVLGPFPLEWPDQPDHFGRIG